MKHNLITPLVVAAALFAGTVSLAAEPRTVALPKPDVTGKVTLEQAIAARCASTRPARSRSPRSRS